MSDGLNSAQRNSLAVTLAGFERSLRQAAAWLDESRPEGAASRMALTLPPQTRRVVLAAIEQALDLIDQVTQRFALERPREALANRIAAEMAVSWANLADAQSSKLTRYGQVDPRLAESLDPLVMKLGEYALLISRLVGSPHGGATSDPAP